MTEENTEFDFQKALKGIQEGKPFTGKNGVLTWEHYLFLPRNL